MWSDNVPGPQEPLIFPVTGRVGSKYLAVSLNMRASVSFFPALQPPSLQKPLLAGEELPTRLGLRIWTQGLGFMIAFAGGGARLEV